jgi:hypothetical protein
MADPSSALCERDRLQSEHYASGDFGTTSIAIYYLAYWLRAARGSDAAARNVKSVRTELNGADGRH